MSVINTMLRSLDARHASPLPSRAPVPASLAGAPGQRSHRLGIIVVVGGLLVATLTLADWPALMNRWQQTPPPQPLVLATGVAELSASPSSTLADGMAPTANATPPSAPAGAQAVVQADASNAAPKTAHTTAHTAPPTAAITTAPAKAPADARVATAMPPPATAVLAEPARTPSALPATPGSSMEPALPPLGTVQKTPSARNPAQRAQAAHAQAMDAAQSGRPRQALTHAQEALRHDPAHTSSRHLAAVLLHEQGESERAVALLRDGLASQPRQDSLALLLSRLLADQEQTGAALATLDQHALHNAEAEGLRAGLWARQGQWQRAQTAFEAALRQQPGNATWWLGLGVARESAGQPQQARPAYLRAQSLGLPSDDLAAYVAHRLNTLPAPHDTERVHAPTLTP